MSDRGLKEVAEEMLACANAWEPAACLVGNVTAEEMGRVASSILAVLKHGIQEPSLERYTVMCDDDCHNYIVPESKVKDFEKYASQNWEVMDIEMPKGCREIDGVYGKIFFREYDYE